MMWSNSHNMFFHIISITVIYQKEIIIIIIINLLHEIKVSIRPYGFFRFRYLYNILMSSNPKKWIPMLFAKKSSLNFLLWPCPMKLIAQWKNGDEWHHFRNILKHYVFILLAWQPHCFANFSLFVCFFVE